MFRFFHFVFFALLTSYVTCQTYEYEEKFIKIDYLGIASVIDDVAERNDAVCSGVIGRSKPIGDWNKLWIKSRQNSYENKQDLFKIYYCFGYVEGLLTFNEINEFFTNMYADWFTDFSNSPKPKPIYDFLDKNYDYIVKKASEMDELDPLERYSSLEEVEYWQEISLVLSQLRGLYDGYLQSMKITYPLFLMPLKFSDILFINADGDIETLISSLASRMDVEQKSDSDFSLRNGDLDYTPRNSHSDKLSVKKFSFESQKETRCSALIKPVVKNGDVDIFIGHTTWDHYESLGPRFLKSYDFRPLEGGEKGRLRTSTGLGSLNEQASKRSFIMSSSAGMLSSVDDFYIVNNDLVVLETTNEVFSKEILKSITPKSVLSWIRVRIANLHSSPKIWSQVFSKYNSGTYNNHWMVINTRNLLASLSDISKIDKAENENEDSFSVLEQLPKFIKYEDQTQALIKQGYWASYNVAYYKEIASLSNYTEQTPKDEYQYDHCPRANIFRREVNKGINSIEDFKKVLRYNKYESDEYSKGNACYAISSRCDLNDINSGKYKASGGIDTKVVSVKDLLLGFDNFKFYAQLGPSYDDQPVFEWREVEDALKDSNYASPTHVGQSFMFSFDWHLFVTQPNLE